MIFEIERPQSSIHFRLVAAGISTSTMCATSSQWVIIGVPWKANSKYLSNTSLFHCRVLTQSLELLLDGRILTISPSKIGIHHVFLVDLLLGKCLAKTLRPNTAALLLPRIAQMSHNELIEFGVSIFRMDLVLYGVDYWSYEKVKVNF